MKYTFPAGFLWGSATAAHQVEGDNKNSDWWSWEHSQQRSAQLRKQNKNPESYFSARGDDSYHRYEEDFDIAKQLHQNAHRISIEWARIEPQQGTFDQEEIAHYKKVLQALKHRGFTVFVTLHHFTNPVWFSELGGWEYHDSVTLFLRYAMKVLHDLHQYIDFVCVINEPNIYEEKSYIMGAWPPQKRNVIRGAVVFENIMQAHVAVYKFCKIRGMRVQVGTAYNVMAIHGRGWWKLLEGSICKQFYLNAIKRLAKHSDFIGIHYYTRLLIGPKLLPPFARWVKEFPVSDFDWEIYPRGLYEVLMQMKQFNRPIYITENGIADAADKHRKEFIHAHVVAANRAIASGVDVRGYLHWSLIDNFEWAEGYDMQFGLVHINREHGLRREVRASAQYYAEICKHNYVED